MAKDLMRSDLNLLFGVLAVQIDLIDPQQFAEACTHWTTKKDMALADILVDLGWISEADKSEVQRFVERRLQKHKGDIEATLAGSIDNEICVSVAQHRDADIEDVLLRLSHAPHRDLVTTVRHVPNPQDRYALTSLHGRGGIGRVWLARDRQLRRDVALKELRPQVADTPTVKARFLNEAQVTAQLEHPGIVPVYELAHWRKNQQPYYIMKYVSGRTLTELIGEYHQKKRESKEDCMLDLVALLSAFVVVCNTVAYAHSRGVIHRDLKGQNIIQGDFGEVIVVDWGLAKLVSDSETDKISGQPVRFQSDSQLTMDGEVVGTPAYMAPEQAGGQLESIDHRTDIYGLGAILYEILTGQPPHAGSDVADVLRRILEDEPDAPSQLNDVPKNLESICLRAIAKNPSDRHQSALDLAQEVLKWQEVQRQEAIQALKESEALYHGLVETLPLILWRKDREGRFTFLNKGHQDLFAQGIDEILGQTDFDLFPFELAQKYRSDDRKVLETGTCLETEEQTDKADGRRIHIRTFKAPVFNAQGDIIGTQGFCWDITEYKSVKAALEKTKSELEECKKQLHS